MANKIPQKVAVIATAMLAFAGMATASFMPAGYMPDDDDVKPKIIIDTTDYVGGETPDTITPRWLPGQLKDTVQAINEWEAKQKQNLRAQIHILTRSYGDSIVLRWAPDDFASWKFLCNKGVNIMRSEVGKEGADTLVMNLKPATLEEFRAAYSETDSLAGMAMGALYNEDQLRVDQTSDPEGGIVSIYEIYQEQQMTFGVAVLMSELRRDLADKLAMRFVDRNVKKGATYQYFIVPTEYDETGHIILDAGVTEEVKNEKYKPEPFDVAMGDSIVSNQSIRLWWERRDYTSYEVERRKHGESSWKRLNDKPYVIMFPEQENLDCFYGDQLDQPGTYEYRVFAHDPFGDLTESSPIHTVVFPDLVPPRPPMLKYIDIDRPDEDNPGAEVWATIHFEKDTLEEDFVGMIPMYYHEKATNGEWKPLIDREHILAPTDTVCRINVTYIPSSQLVIAAYDTAQNVSYSIPQLLRVSDMRPPKAPTGLKAKTGFAENEKGEPVGTITLTWDALANDDIDYYEIAFANDTTHQFMQQKHGTVQDTVFVDTVAVDVNQKYIYYKVRAVDYSTNMGEYSEVLQVIRPSLIPPSVAHLDSAYVDGKGVYMKWVAGNDEQMAYHKVYRKLLESDKEWTLIKVCDADSVKAANDFIEFIDKPKENSYEEYVYAIESFNYSDISSGLSLQYITRYTGDLVFSADIKLHGRYDSEKNMTKLAWESTKLPAGKDWFFCIWRKGPEDDRFKFLMSADPDEREFTDYLLNAGETAEYYIQIQMEDGRESEPSNVVSINAPKK